MRHISCSFWPTSCPHGLEDMSNTFPGFPKSVAFEPGKEIGLVDRSNNSLTPRLTSGPLLHRQL
jgi:hypothetical protein